MFSQGGVMFCGIKSGVIWLAFFFPLGSRLTTSSGLLKLWTSILSKLMVIVQYLILIILFHRMVLWIIILFWQSCMTCCTTEKSLLPSFSSCLFHRLQHSSHHSWKINYVLGESDVSGNMKDVSNVTLVIQRRWDKNCSMHMAQGHFVCLGFSQM